MRFMLRIARRVFAISSTSSSTSSIWGANPHESRSRIYRRSVSSLAGINRHRPLYLSAKGVIPFIRSRNELSKRSYIFAARQIKIFLVIQITSITRVILVSLGRADISRVYRNGVWRNEVVMQVENARGD